MFFIYIVYGNILLCNRFNHGFYIPDSSKTVKLKMALNKDRC